MVIIILLDMSNHVLPQISKCCDKRDVFYQDTMQCGADQVGYSTDYRLSNKKIRLQAHFFAIPPPCLLMFNILFNWHLLIYVCSNLFLSDCCMGLYHIFNPKVVYFWAKDAVHLPPFIETPVYNIDRLSTKLLDNKSDKGLN